MTVQRNVKRLLRLLLYFAGLLCVAFGVAVAIKSDLGISSISSLSYAIYNVLLHNGVTALSYGACVTLSHLCYMLVQAVMLRREYQIKNLLQILVSTVFGRFVDLAVAIVGPAFEMAYLARLALLALAILLLAAGITLYVGVDVVPMPGDGLSVAISKKVKRLSFPRIRGLVDCAFVASAVITSLVGTGRVVGVREGTVLAALFVGPLTGLLKPWAAPVLKRVR